jgi:hypothetical protein
MKQIEATCHTNVNLEYFASTSAEAAALLGGSVQFVQGGIAASLDTIQNGDDAIAVLAASSEGGASIYVASKRYQANGVGINALKKFVGVNWGVPSLGGAGSIFDASIAHKIGVPESSIHFVVQGNNGEPGLISNQVQLAISAPSNLEPALQTGNYYIVWYSSGAQAIALDGAVVGSGLMATRTTMARYPVLTQLVVTDNIKALLWTRKNADHPQAVWNVFSPAAKAGYPYSVFGPSWDLARAQGLVMTGYYDQSEYQSLANRYFNVGLLSQQVRVPAFDAPTSYVTKAYKTLGLTPPTSDLDASQLFWASEARTGIKTG